MKTKKFYRYIGIILLIVPFLAIYQYLKNAVYVIIAFILIASSFRRQESASSKQTEREQTKVNRSFGAGVKKDDISK